MIADGAATSGKPCGGDCDGYDADGGGGSCGSSSKSSIGCNGCSGSISVGSISTFASSALSSGATFASESRSFSLDTVDTGGPGCSGSSGRFSIRDGSLQPSGCEGSSAIIQSPVGGPGGIFFAGRSTGSIVGPPSPTVIVQSPLGVCSSTAAALIAAFAGAGTSAGGLLVIIAGPLCSSPSASITDVSRAACS